MRARPLGMVGRSSVPWCRRLIATRATNPGAEVDRATTKIIGQLRAPIANVERFRTRKATLMHAVNQINSLYFFPHKLSFAPGTVDAATGRYGGWLPSDHGSVARRWEQPASAFLLPTQGIPRSEPLQSDREATGFDRVDDATPIAPPSSER